MIFLLSLNTETASSFFTTRLNEILPLWLTKSWMIFRLPHSQSHYYINSFCSMCPKIATPDISVHSHVYSEGFLKHVCGRSDRNLIWIAHSKPPKTLTAPKDCKFELECRKCDNSTSVIEQSFIMRYQSGYYDDHTELVAEDAVLVHVIAPRGLQVNTDLAYHCFFCCRRYVNHLSAFFDRALRYRDALKEIKKLRELDINLKKEAVNWTLFCTKPASEFNHFLTEFPLLRQVNLSEVNEALDQVGQICLIFGQITNSCREGTPGTKNHLCWAIPLVEDTTMVEKLRPHFPNIVDHVNKKLQHKRTEYFKSIGRDKPHGLKLVVGYLKECS